MTKQELNLLNLPIIAVTQLRTGSPQVMRCNMLQPCSLAAGFDDIPNDVLRDALAPDPPGSGDCSKESSLRDCGAEDLSRDERREPGSDGAVPGDGDGEVRRWPLHERITM